MAYDSWRGRVVMFGGAGGSPIGAYLGDTWELAAVNPALQTAYGAGCATGAGTAILAAEPGGLPWLGGSVRLLLSQLPPARVALLGYGGSRTSWGAFALPLDLGAFGMPGCALHSSLERVDVLLNLGGSAKWELRVPESASLLGAELYEQGLVVDPAANAFGLALSNASASRVGAR